MSEYNNKGNNKPYDVNFSEYDFCNEAGRFVYKLMLKKMCPSGNMQLFLLRRDGKKHKGIVYPDRGFLGMDKINVGSVLDVEYVCSQSGKFYIKSISLRNTV